MSIPCGDPNKLINTINTLYTTQVQSSRPSTLCTKFVFESGFVVNVFDNGTVNFQGKPDEKTKADIEAIIATINNQ